MPASANRVIAALANPVIDVTSAIDIATKQASKQAIDQCIPKTHSSQNKCLECFPSVSEGIQSLVPEGTSQAHVLLENGGTNKCRGGFGKVGKLGQQINKAKARVRFLAPAWVL